MKKPDRILLAFTVLLWTFIPPAAAGSLSEFLDHIDAREVRMLAGESLYDTIMEVMFLQPVDHRNPDAGQFTQRIYISHRDNTLPVVLSTEGYDAPYYYTTELAAHLRCNQLMAEHRYFGRSVPDSLDWAYLDTWQAASDHHRIVQTFKEFYPEDWIATGISKGGQAVMFHSLHYPEDVKVRVPYVAPLNYEVEDVRIYDFLDRVGSKKERRKVFRFQKMMLKHQDRYMDAFREFSEEEGYTYDIAGGTEKAYEYCVLEYSFAYWQWAYCSMEDIPGRWASPGALIAHMNRVGGFDYFDDEGLRELRPYFYQTLTETGYYGYRLEDFSPWLQHVETRDFRFTFADEDLPDFNPDISIELEEYLATRGENFIYIYGGNDTWSATAFTAEGLTSSKIFVKEGGSHRTRINNMPPEQKEAVYELLASFLEN
jgi:hypothetical protein